MVASLWQNPTAGFSRDQVNAPLITQPSFDYTLYIPHRGVFLHISTGESLMIIPNHFSQIPDYPKISPAGAFTLYGRMMCYIHYWVPKINYPQSQVDHYTIMSQRPLNSDLSPYWTSRYHVENNLWIAQIPQWSIILSSLTVGIRPLSP